MASKTMKLSTFKKRQAPPARQTDLFTPAALRKGGEGVELLQRAAERQGNMFGEAAGTDPVKASKMLGISRQAVHKAIEAGKLDAYRIVMDGDPEKVLFIVVTYESIENYQFIRKHRNRSG